MTSAEVPARRSLLAPAIAVLLGGAVVAPAASGDVLRITSAPGQDAADVTVATFPASARADGIAGRPVTGLPAWITTYEAAPGDGAVAYAGSGMASVAPPDPATGPVDDPLSRPLAGLLPVGGGPVVPFSGLSGGVLGRAFRSGTNAANEQPDPWITWSPDGTSVVLHAFGRDPRRDPWFAAPDARRCDVATARCTAPVARDVVDLPGGGTVETEAGLSVPIGARRTFDRDVDTGPPAARRFRARAERRYAVTVRVAGRPGVPATWRTSGVLRDGSPAFDRAIPSAAGVLVRTSRVRAPKQTPRTRGLGVSADAGKAVVVRRDGTIRPLGRFGYEVVGTLPDGRWMLTGGPGRRFERGPTGQPLRTLDADGRIAPLTSGARVVSPVWAASLAGLPDSAARTAEVERAGIDAASGLLVLVMRFQDGGEPGRVVVLPADGSSPPRLLRDPPARRTSADYLVR